MKNSTQRRCFKIGGNNVNGASSQGKMAQILTFARSFDIFCLQDTRLVNDPLQGPMPFGRITCARDDVRMAGSVVEVV